MIPDSLQTAIKEAEASMDEAVQFCKKEFTQIRAGKASPALIEHIRVEYYGTQTPLNQLATISTPEARLLVVEPYDKSAIQDVEKAIMSSGLGLNPNNDGQLIRIPLPMLTEERRKELVKHAKEIAEEARISIRNARRDANDAIKSIVKQESLPEDSQYEAEDLVQKKTDAHIELVGTLLDQKEKDILTV
ncbi:MAG: ribosome recycling factor [Balneolaceae bacterium]